jgi:signal transduction histidine kinase/CheY-like chemotaxis protein
VPPIDSKPLYGLYRSVVVTSLLAAFLVLVSFWLQSRTLAEEEMVRHTLAVREQITQVVLQLQNAETGQRGYLLTGRDVYLEPYEAAVTEIAHTLDELAKLTNDNPVQQQSIGRLRQLSLDKLAELEKTIADRKANRLDAALATVNTDVGKSKMDDIRRFSASMLTEENRLLDIRRDSRAAYSFWLLLGTALALIAIFASGALSIYSTRRSFGDLALANERLNETNRQLADEMNQRARVEDQLRQSQKMEAIGQLSGGIAHDFNNMLGAVIGSLDLLARRIKNGDFNVERFVDAATKASQRAAVLTQRLLAFARKQPLSPQPLDPNKMISEMSELLRQTLGSHIRIETVLAAGTWETIADTSQLENAILNIAVNARDAMPEGGKLTIETANAYLDDAYARDHTEVEPGQYVMIAMTDTGPGMPPDVVTRAFDPFFTTKAIGLGTGLGLSQVHGFVKQSHGHIKIYTEPGAGTTLKIYLPRLRGEAPELVRRAPPGAAPAGKASEFILVVEDDPLMRRTATESLRELGYTVFDFGNPREALAHLESNPDIQLLFTDIVMPDLNGKKLADEALQLRSALKVIFTTGYTANAVVHGGVLDAGVNFLGKPYTLEQLATKVRDVLDK